jgi:hypothetical protein
MSGVHNFAGRQFLTSKKLKFGGSMIKPIAGGMIVLGGFAASAALAGYCMQSYYSHNDYKKPFGENNFSENKFSENKITFSTSTATPTAPKDDEKDICVKYGFISLEGFCDSHPLTFAKDD